MLPGIKSRHSSRRTALFRPVTQVSEEVADAQAPCRLDCRFGSVSRSHVGPRSTGHRGHRREGGRRAGCGPARRRDRRDERSHGGLSRGGQRPRRNLFPLTTRAGHVPDRRAAGRVPHERAPRVDPAGRDHHDHEPGARGRRARGNRHRHGPFAARRHDERASGRQRRDRRAQRASGDEPQLLRRRCAPAGRSVYAVESDGQRHGHGLRPVPAGEQCHGRRRLQRGRRARRHGGRAGADADRSDSGIPGDDQHVRRRIRPRERRRRQRGHQVRDQPVQGRGVPERRQQRLDIQGFPGQAGQPDETYLGEAGLGGCPRRAGRQEQGALLRQPRAAGGQPDPDAGVSDAARA